MEYYCAIRNDEQEDFREPWKDLYDMMLSKRSRTRRTLCTATTTVCKSFFWQTWNFVIMQELKKNNNSQWFSKTKCLPHSEKELWNSFAECS